MRIRHFLTAGAFSMSVVACGPGSEGPSADASAVRDGATTAPVDFATGTIGDSGGGDPLASAYKELRSVMHVHSVFSHDACDGNPQPNGQNNQPCWDDLRAAVCSVGLAYVGMTDHPAFMRDHSMDGEMLFDASKGDVPLVEDGVVIGNQLRCADGHTLFVTEGFEAEHTLPVGFTSQPTTDSAYSDLLDARPLADMQAMVGELKGHGALVASVHSERDDVSAATLLGAGAEAMEWYNPHGNFLTLLGSGNGIALGALDALKVLGQLGPFMTGSTSGAHPDLVYLLFLPKWPQAGFDKWYEAARTRTIPGILGSDVHENVSVTPQCSGTALIACQLAAASIPGSKQSLALLVAGGQIVMSDGRRFDAYERVLRWLENRVLVSERSPSGFKEGLRAGRSYGLFTVFGEPDTFRFVGQAGGSLVEMGAETQGPVTLTVKLPSRAVQLTGAQFSPADGEKVELVATLFRTSSTETQPVASSSVRGDTITFTATAPGAYNVEIWIKPRHLSAALGTQSALADTSYMWLITNPIRVLP